MNKESVLRVVKEYPQVEAAIIDIAKAYYKIILGVDEHPENTFRQGPREDVDTMGVGEIFFIEENIRPEFPEPYVHVMLNAGYDDDREVEFPVRWLYTENWRDEGDAIIQRKVDDENKRKQEAKDFMLSEFFLRSEDYQWMVLTRKMVTIEEVLAYHQKEPGGNVGPLTLKEFNKKVHKIRSGKF
jgi:hypothetical protein